MLDVIHKNFWWKLSSYVCQRGIPGSGRLSTLLWLLDRESSYFGPHLVLVIHTRLLKIAVELDRHKNFLYFLLDPVTAAATQLVYDYYKRL